MYNENNLVYILTMLEAIEKIKIYTSEFDNPDDFLWSNQQLNFNGSVNLLIAIGEESKKIDDRLKEEFPIVKWKAISGMRDKLSHDYRCVDANIVWSVINNELDNLKKTLIKMLSKIDYERKILEKALNTQYYCHLRYLRAEGKSIDSNDNES